MTPLDPALLAAIRHAPDDDAPRLIAADWWQERGEDARAEFVRIQVELARCPKCKGTGSRPNPATVGDGTQARTVMCCSGRMSKALRKRERELLTLTNRWAWAGQPLGDLNNQVRPEYHTEDPSGFMWDFHRGFIESVACTARGWIAYGDDVVAREPVTVVTLTTEPDLQYHRGWLTLPGREKHGWRQDDEPTWQPLCLRLLRAEWPTVREWHLPAVPGIHALPPADRHRLLYGEWDAGRWYDPDDLRRLVEEVAYGSAPSHGEIEDTPEARHHAREMAVGHIARALRVDVERVRREFSHDPMIHATADEVAGYLMGRRRAAMLDLSAVAGAGRPWEAARD